MRGLKDELLEKRLEIMLKDINLTEVQNQIIETLSKGYKRRVGIAQALIHDPDILILDEPTDGLDPNQKFEMRKLIKSISKNKGIIISTHILEEVEAVCSRTIIISSGKVLLNKETKDILKNKKENLDSIFRKITK
jgi:ABC-2 type transport system ATP-binding protein